MDWSKWHRVTLVVTAYARGCCQCPFHSTSSGTWPTRGTAAVDTDLFAFGTQFIVPAYGWAIARDRGGAVKGHHIDLVFPSCRSAIEWGRKRLVVLFKRPT